MNEGSYFGIRTRLFGNYPFRFNKGRVLGRLGREFVLRFPQYLEVVQSAVADWVWLSEGAFLRSVRGVFSFP